MTKDALQGFPSDTSSSTSLIIALEPLVLWKSAIKFVSHARPCCRNTVPASLWWTHSCGQAELDKQERWKRLNPRDWLYSHLMASQSPKTRQETSFLWLSVTKTKRSRWENGRLNEDKQRHKVCESETARLLAAGIGRPKMSEMLCWWQRVKPLENTSFIPPTSTNIKRKNSNLRQVWFCVRLQELPVRF